MKKLILILLLLLSITGVSWAEEGMETNPPPDRVALLATISSAYTVATGGSGTWGITSPGASWSFPSTSRDQCYKIPTTAPQTGSITTAYVYIRNNTSYANEVKLAVYGDTGGSPASRVCVTAAISMAAYENYGSGGWKSSACSGSITSGNTYWFCVHGNVGTTSEVAFDVVTSGDEKEYGVTGYADAFPNPMSGTEYNGTIGWAIKVDYTY